MKKFFLAIVLAVLSSCTDEEGAKKTLEAAGYTDVQITGYRALMSGRDEQYSTGFKAKGPTGKPVTGAVTKGPFKGSTIRLD